MKLSVVTGCIFAFGMSFGMSSANAFDAECRQVCITNYTECMQEIHDPADCGRELRACQRGCASSDD